MPIAKMFGEAADEVALENMSSSKSSAVKPYATESNAAPFEKVTEIVVAAAPAP